MSRLFAVGVWGLAVLGAGCAGGDAPELPFIGCRGDSDCSDNKVCFSDGCGDPGRDIVVEVVPNPKAGLYAQDLRVDDLRNPQPLELDDPATLQGRVLVQQLTSRGTYGDRVTLRLTGESLLIPGVQRLHESSLVPQGGAYSLPVGAGRYNVTLLTADAELPPVSDTRDVRPGPVETLDFVLPSPLELVRLSGRVLRLAGRPVDVGLEVQALDEAERPLSQRVSVTRSTGEFTLALSRADALRSRVLLQVVPTSADAAVPQKLFSVSPRDGLTEALLLGDYGDTVRLRGRAVDLQGQPVAQATVSLSGPVGGGGSYRSPKVLTGPDGSFELLTLPSAPDTRMTLSVAPPPTSAAGQTQQFVLVPRASATQLPPVVCQERVRVGGTLLKPTNSVPAGGVRVMAEPLEALPGLPRPATSFEAVRPTDDTGRFELALDPGRYRLDFLPGEDLPRVSRIVTVRPGVDGTSDTLELSSFTLSKGRSVTGQVSFTGERLARPSAPYASVRFFRVVDVEGKRSALLLAQTLTDQSGNYITLLPTR